MIPCLDEARGIAGVVRGLAGTVAEVLVVDDGSADGTADVARAAGARVLRNPVSQGKGAALAQGWAAAAASGAEWVLLLDGDGQHDPADAPSLLAAAEAGADLVVGNRMPGSAAMPWLRRATNRWMSRRISRLAGVEVPDSQCGFRLARLSALLGLRLRTQGFEIESEMTVAFGRAGFRVASVPIRVRYGPERSKISPVRDTLRWFRWYRST